jgi:hypothetical protein
VLLTFPDEHAARRAVSGLHDEGIPLALLRVVPPDDGPVPPIRIARRVAAAATVVAAVVGALVLPDPAVAAPVLAAVAGDSPASVDTSPIDAGATRSPVARPDPARTR